MGESTQIRLERASVFFRQPVWSRLLEALYEKYIALGRTGGQIVLVDASQEERREIASFLNRRLVAQGDLVVRLSDFQRALAASVFACELPELLYALYPQRAMVSRPQQREIQTLAHQRFYTALLAILQEQPEQADGARWLREGRHGLEWLFARYKNAPEHEQDDLFAILRLVLQALTRLPLAPHFERLAPFAQRISGDPHFFDADTLAGRLLFFALNDFVEIRQAGNGLVEQQEIGERQRWMLYYDVGLLLDTISSTVAVYNLAWAQNRTGQEDPLLEQVHGRIMILPLRQVLAWMAVRPMGLDVYMFENPPVFETVVDALIQENEQRPGEIHPTLICTAGWPSTAVIRLLTLLVETVPDVRLHYSGDFDVRGLQIAAYFLARYPRHCQLWQYTPAAYKQALHQRSETLREDELETLKKLSSGFTFLIDEMKAERKKAYQEGISALLLHDISG